MSHFLYIHPCMSGTPGVWKVGVSKTPYSAVRARQRYTWNKFGLEYLYFGRPDDIGCLEKMIKDYFSYCSGKTLQGYGTELFKVDVNLVRKYIAIKIHNQKLDVKPVVMKQSYTASSSGQCPFGIPTEQDADFYLNRRVNEMFGNSPRRLESAGKQILLGDPLEVI